jgi:tight adherence protein B
VSPALLALMTFGAVAMAVAGVYSILADLFLRDRARVNERLNEEFRNRQRDQARKALLFKNKNPAPPADDPAAAGGVEAPGLRRRLTELVEQSGLALTVRRLLMLTVAAGLGLGLAGGLLRQSVLIGSVGALIGANVPVFYVRLKRKARLEKLLSQLPDAFDLMGRVIRAGQSMGQGMLAVANEFPQPIRGEFSLCYEQQNLGISAEDALRDLARRTGLLEVKIFVLAVLVQQQTGGNLAELLDKLASMIRDRYRIRGMIKALTAEGRLQAIILLGLPPGIFVLMLIMNATYGQELLAYPGLLVGTLAFEGVGALWIRKIVNFDY